VRAGRLVAVVVPVPRFPLSADEEISMLHLRKYLGKFDRYMICPQRLPKEFSDFSLQRFPKRYFANRLGYNRLLLSKKFYQAFAAYEYILIYQLDCLVFASNLEEWCRKDWDYVGAPWFRNDEKPEEGFLGVGNGGLSLRRVSTALAVFKSKRMVQKPELRGADFGRAEFIKGLKFAAPLARLIFGTKTALHRVGYRNTVPWLTKKLADVKLNEDYFWAFGAYGYVDDFRIPSIDEALGFSFEVAPRYCFEVSSGRIPFGCHAWAKYDREFWQPYLLRLKGNEA
jgi:hypothetical protein